MPIVRKQDGWYWGSKGPFSTKSKALQVAQAAHASGFKEIEMNTALIGDFIATLLHSATITHFMHLQSVSYSEHKALGKYYEEIVELADTVAEAIQGCEGILIKSYPTMYGYPEVTPLQYLTIIRDYVITHRDGISEYSNIQNEIDAVMTLLDSTIYKLTFLK
jgi:hypothetical protein